MMADGWLAGLGALTLAALLALLWRPLRRFGQEVQIERAAELFRLQRPRLEALFLRQAAAVGKPRGARWVSPTFQDGMVLARDLRSGQVVALLPFIVRFEPLPDSPLEAAVAAGEAREASAVFLYERGAWHTVGQALFNMAPERALEHLHEQYERLGPGPTPAPLASETME